MKNQTDGLNHFTAAGYTSRYEIAKFILQEKNIGAIF